jgi:signal transduction histidine kinase
VPVAYTVSMPLPSVYGRIATPLAFAGYLTWAAVALELWLASGRWAPVGGVPARVVVVGLLLTFLAAFVARLRAAPGDYRGLDAPLLITAVAALAVLLPGRSGTGPVLLIIVAAGVSSAFRPRGALVFMALVNAAFLAILLLVWRVGTALPLFAIYVGFQAFAAVVSAALARAERTAEELRVVNSELLLTRSLLAESARDGERLRVSRELHDVVGHRLTALTLNLELLGDAPGLADRREFLTSRQLTRELLDDVRNVVSRLRRDDGVALHDALERLAAPFPRPHVHVDVAADARAPDADRAEIVLRAAQEALTNAARHASAANVWLSLRTEGGLLRLSVEDDGRAPDDVQPGNGLTGLRERLEGAGGRLELGRGARGGLRLVATVPTAESAA